MTTARFLPGAATGVDGVIYALGGYTLPGILSGAEAYDPVTNTWTGIANMPRERGELGAATGMDGRIYAIGGVGFNEDISEFASMNRVEAYDPVTDTWTPVANMGSSRGGLGAATGADGRIYAIGGRDENGVVLSTVEAYDPVTNTWTPVAAMSTARYFLAAATGGDGRIYAIGGQDNTAFDLNTVEAYDPVTDTWTSVDNMSTARMRLAAATGADGRIYAIGGYNGFDLFLNTVEAYDPVTDTWTAVASMGSARSGLGGATGADGTVYAIGGYDGTSVLSSVEAYGTVVAPQPTTLFLHGSGGIANPPTLYLDDVSPTAATAKYKDSPAIKFSGGNLWKDVGTWTAASGESNGQLTVLGDAHLWLGLKNSDDQGTRFDVRVELYKNGAQVASGERYCIQGVTRNANSALEVITTFAPFAPVSYNGTSDVLSLKVVTRIGTNGSGTFCGGHSSAVGLRTYFDATNRPAQFDATF